MPFAINIKPNFLAQDDSDRVFQFMTYFRHSSVERMQRSFQNHDVPYLFPTISLFT